MVLLVEVECENKNHWYKIKKTVSNCLFEKGINYKMVDQEYGKLPRTFDIEVKIFKVA